LGFSELFVGRYFPGKTKQYYQKRVEGIGSWIMEVEGVMLQEKLHDVQRDFRRPKNDAIGYLNFFIIVFL
jgi:hypothetical protein